MTQIGWASTQDVDSVWPGFPVDGGLIFLLLEVAQQQVVAYAPPLPDGDLVEVPSNYRLAQIMQARNIYNATIVDPSSGGAGEDTFQIRPFPLDWMIKQILRPKRAVPVLG